MPLSMKSQKFQKFQSLEILKERATRQRIHLKNNLIKKTFNGFKMSSFKCMSHVQEINMPKNMFDCPFKLILGLFKIFFHF
jgi:hypothetical protein